MKIRKPKQSQTTQSRLLERDLEKRFISLVEQQQERNWADPGGLGWTPAYSCLPRASLLHSGAKPGQGGSHGAAPGAPEEPRGAASPALSAPGRGAPAPRNGGRGAPPNGQRGEAPGPRGLQQGGGPGGWLRARVAAGPGRRLCGHPQRALRGEEWPRGRPHRPRPHTPPRPGCCSPPRGAAVGGTGREKRLLPRFAGADGGTKAVINSHLPKAGCSCFERFSCKLCRSARNVNGCLPAEVCH